MTQKGHRKASLFLNMPSWSTEIGWDTEIKSSKPKKASLALA